MTVSFSNKSRNVSSKKKSYILHFEAKVLSDKHFLQCTLPRILHKYACFLENQHKISVYISIRHRQTEEFYVIINLHGSPVVYLIRIQLEEIKVHNFADTQ